MKIKFTKNDFTENGGKLFLNYLDILNQWESDSVGKTLNTIKGKDFDMNKLFFCRIFVGFLPFYLQNPTKILQKKSLFISKSLLFIVVIMLFNFIYNLKHTKQIAQCDSQTPSSFTIMCVSVS